MSGCLSLDSSRESKRRKPTPGGAKTCYCGNPLAPHSGYCKTHKREYQARWARNKTEELKRLRALMAEIEGAKG